MTTIGLPSYDALPETLPLFVLTGALLLPQGNLPLNIFEPKYVAMLDDALRSNRLIGMIQPRADGLYETGCAGKITSFQESDDGRYLISLTGVSRFKITQEIETMRGYRQAKIKWENYKTDLESPALCLDMDRHKLTSLLKSYFQKKDMDVEWDMVEIIPDQKLMIALAMICPFAPDEKQALLEAQTCKERADIFVKLLKMEVMDSADRCASFH